MRPHWKSLAAVLAAVTALSTLSACSRAGGAPGASASSSLLKQIQERGTIRVGDCLSFAPFGFFNKQGKPDGYDVDIAKQMATALGVKLDMVDTTSANRIPNLRTNKVDVVICNFTENTERAKQIAFTDPYVVAGEALLVRKASHIAGIQDMGGKTVATVKGSTDAALVKQLNPKARTQDYDSSQAAILAVRQGQANAMIEDSNFLTYQAKLDPSLSVTHSSLVPLEYNGFGVVQGDPIWLDWLNQFLFQLNTSGTNKQLYKKWFGVAPRYPLQPSY